MKHKRIAKVLANALGLALLATPIAMSFTGCNKSENQGVDLYSVDISDYNSIDLSFYEDAIAYQAQLASTQNESTKCLGEEKAKAYADVMYSIGNEYAQNQLLFNKIDANNNQKTNAFNNNYAMFDTFFYEVLNKQLSFEILYNNEGVEVPYGDFLKYSYEDKISAVLVSSDYVSEKDFIDGYVSFLNGYFDNATNYILSNYTRYEDLTDEQINQIIDQIEGYMSATASDYINHASRYFNKYEKATSLNSVGLSGFAGYLEANGIRISIPDVVNNFVDNLYPVDLMYFEQPYIDAWQKYADPLFQENFGYTWTDCVKLTEDPDLHPINWDQYENCLALIGMTEDDIPMPTIS